MDNEMIERCKTELERCFAPAIDFKAPYAKVMSDMAIKAIIKAMREPTEKMLSADEVHPSCHMCGGHKEGWQNMIDAIIT